MNPTHSTDAELDEFEQVCRRLNGFNEAISFEWVDGFLTTLAAAPRVPPADEWLPAMFDDTFERTFADPQDHAQALAVLQRRLDVLCTQLDPEALFDEPEVLRLEPILAEWTDAERQRGVEAGVDAEYLALLRPGALWAVGFLDGIEALSEIWTEPGDAEAAELFGEAIDQIAALALPEDSEALREHLQRYHPKQLATREELLAEAFWSVQDLRMYWVDFAPKTAPRRVDPTPGRNDPCPCGSGRKYKKCHGAPARA